MFPLRHEFVFVFGEKVYKLNSTTPKRSLNNSNAVMPMRSRRQTNGSMKVTSARPLKEMLKPGDKEYKKIKNSIEEFGFADPLVVNKDMTIIGGYQRLHVAVDLGYTEVQCAVVDVDKMRTMT